MLSDSACFACCNVSVSDTVEDRSLTVVNVTHYNNDRAAFGSRFAIIVISVVNETLLNGNDNFLFNLCAEFLSNERSCVKVDHPRFMEAITPRPMSFLITSVAVSLETV